MKLLQDLFKDVTYSVNERVKNPFWFSFVTAFLYFNLNAVMKLLDAFKASDNTLRESYLKELDFEFWIPLYWAFWGFIAFYIIYLLSLSVSIVVQEKVKPNLHSILKSKRFTMSDRVEELKSRIESFKKSIDDLQDENSRLRGENVKIREELNAIESFDKYPPERSSHEIVNTELDSALEVKNSEKEDVREMPQKDESHDEMEALQNSEYFKKLLRDRIKFSIIEKDLEIGIEDSNHDLIEFQRLAVHVLDFFDLNYPKSVANFLANPSQLKGFLLERSRFKENTINTIIGRIILDTEALLRTFSEIKNDINANDEYLNRIKSYLAIASNRSELRKHVKWSLKSIIGRYQSVEMYSNMADDSTIKGTLYDPGFNDYISDKFMDYEESIGALNDLLNNRIKFIDLMHEKNEQDYDLILLSKDLVLNVVSHLDFAMKDK